MGGFSGRTACLGYAGSTWDCVFGGAEGARGLKALSHLRFELWLRPGQRVYAPVCEVWPGDFRCHSFPVCTHSWGLFAMHLHLVSPLVISLHVSLALAA